MAVSKKGSRGIVVEGEQWRWKVSKKLTVVLWDSEDQTHFPKLQDIIGEYMNGYNRGEDPSVMPSQIAAHILTLQKSR